MRNIISAVLLLISTTSMATSKVDYVELLTSDPLVSESEFRDKVGTPLLAAMHSTFARNDGELLKATMSQMLRLKSSKQAAAASLRKDLQAHSQQVRLRALGVSSGKPVQLSQRSMILLAPYMIDAGVCNAGMGNMQLSCSFSDRLAQLMVAGKAATGAPHGSELAEIIALAQGSSSAGTQDAAGRQAGAAPNYAMKRSSAVNTGDLDEQSGSGCDCIDPADLASDANPAAVAALQASLDASGAPQFCFKYKYHFSFVGVLRLDLEEFIALLYTVIAFADSSVRFVIASAIADFLAESTIPNLRSLFSLASEEVVEFFFGGDASFFGIFDHLSGHIPGLVAAGLILYFSKLEVYGEIYLLAEVAIDTKTAPSIFAMVPFAYEIEVGGLHECGVSGNIEEFEDCDAIKRIYVELRPSAYVRHSINACEVRDSAEGELFYMAVENNWYDFETMVERPEYRGLRLEPRSAETQNPRYVSEPDENGERNEECYGPHMEQITSLPHLCPYSSHYAGRGSVAEPQETPYEPEANDAALGQALEESLPDWTYKYTAIDSWDYWFTMAILEEQNQVILDQSPVSKECYAFRQFKGQRARGDAWWIYHGQGHGTAITCSDVGQDCPFALAVDWERRLLGRSKTYPMPEVNLLFGHELTHKDVGASCEAQLPECTGTQCDDFEYTMSSSTIGIEGDSAFFEIRRRGSTDSPTGPLQGTFKVKFEDGTATRRQDFEARGPGAAPHFQNCSFPSNATTLPVIVNPVTMSEFDVVFPADVGNTSSINQCVRIFIDVKDDIVEEGTETMSLDAVSSTEGQVGTLVAQVAIIDNETSNSPVGNLRVQNVRHAEGDSGSSRVTVTVYRTQTGFPQTVDVKTVDETAMAPDDYTGVERQVHFSSNASEVRFTIQIHGDTELETAEQFKVEATGKDRFGRDMFAEGTVEILDDDVQTDANGDPLNLPPVAVADQHTWFEDSGFTRIDVMGNDFDPQGETILIHDFTATTPAGATVTYDPNHPSFLGYEAPANYSGEDTITYRVRNASGNASNPATVVVQVLGSNDAPVANPDHVTVPEDSQNNVIDVLANDSDADGTTLTLVRVQNVQSSGNYNTSAHSVEVVGDQVVFTPANQFHGTVTFEYVIRDEAGSEQTGQVTVTVESVNDLPVAGDDQTSTAEDTPAEIYYALNDSDFDSTDLTVTHEYESTEGGTIELVENGVFNHFIYTPPENFTGTDTFTYTLTDEDGGSAMATVTITVLSVNDGPVANPDTATVNEDDEVTIDVLANDIDLDGDALQILDAFDAEKGQAFVENGQVRYQPNANESGTATFKYRISDGSGEANGTSVAVVTVTITPSNDAPIAVNDSASVVEDGSVVVPVLDNDSDPDGDALTVIGATIADESQGTVQFDPTGVTFTPAADFNGTATFTYTITDGQADPVTATVTVTVTPVWDHSTANPDQATTDEDQPVRIAVLDNDQKGDAQQLRIARVTQPADNSGVVTIINNGTDLLYTPNANANGPVQFTYTLVNENPSSTSSSLTTTVDVLVNPINDAPTAVDDTASVAEDNSVLVEVLANDSDAENDTLTVAGATMAEGSQGSVQVTPNGVLYTPPPNFHGTAIFTYLVSDGQLESTATVTVTVQPVWDRPMANPDQATTNEDEAVQVLVLVNDDAGDAQQLRVDSVTQPNSGVVEIIGGTHVRYTPNPDFNGSDVFTYTLGDESGLSPDPSATTTVTIVITPIHDGVEANDDSGEMNEDTIGTFDVLANDSFIDSETVELLIVSGPANGVAEVVDDQIVYTPNDHYFGTEVIEYQIRDAANTSDTATLTITVHGVNDAPVTSWELPQTLVDQAITINVLANERDVDHARNQLTVVSYSQPSGGVVTRNGSQLTFTPDAGFEGKTRFEYVVADPEGAQASSFAEVTVMALNPGAEMNPYVDYLLFSPSTSQ